MSVLLVPLQGLGIFVIPLRPQPLLHWPTIRYTVKDGLAGMQCMSVFQDRRGAVWIGTKSGLSKFNGESFENFTIKDGLFHPEPVILGQDPQGYIWLYCNYRGLMRFDGRDFKKYPIEEQDLIPFLEADGRILMQDVQNRSKYYRFVADTLQPLTFKGISPAVQQTFIGMMPTKNKDSYLFIAKDKLYSYQNQRLSVLKTGHFVFSNGGRRLIYGHNVVHSTEPNGSQVVYTWNGQALTELMRLNVNGQITITTTLPFDYVFNYSNGKTGQTYLLEKNSRNYSVIDPNGQANDVSYQDSPNKPYSTRYIATEKGLIGLVRNGFKNFTEADVPYTWSVVEDKRGDYYFLNFQHSLQKYDGRSLQNIDNYPNKSQIANNWYYHALRDKWGALWLPTAGGIVQYDNQKWRYILGKDKPLAFALAENKNQNTIAACTHNGLLLIDSRPPFRHRLQTGKDTIFQDLVSCVAIAPDGAYWLSGYGIARYDSLKHNTKIYSRGNKKLNAGSIVSLFFDNQGTLWAGSWAKGLFRFNAQKDVFESVFGRWLQGAVPFVEQLDSDHLLVADGLNLYSVSLKDTADVRCFNHHNGFMGLETRQLGSYRDSKGQIWLTSGSVLSVLNPTQILPTSQRLAVGFVSVSRKDSLPVRVPFVGPSQTIELPFSQNTVSFTVESLGEDKPFKTQYSYRVKGFVDEWSAWQPQNVVMLTNLPSGTFTVEVKARRGVLVGESAVAELDFVVAIWFWQSPNFYKYAAVVIAGLLLLALYLSHRHRQRFIENQNQKKQINDREQEVRFLQIQTIQAQMNPHFTFNVLSSIQHLIEINDTEQASANILKLSTLMRSYLEASMIGDGKSESLFKNEITLDKEIELIRMYVEFEQLQYRDKFEFEIDIDPTLITNNYRVPPLILQPFVENAIKHGLFNRKTKGYLWIRFIKIGDETLQCIIEDNGVGRQRAAEIQQNSIKSYKSRGTELVARRVGILNETGYNIDIQINDRPNGGTVVMVFIGYK